VEEILARCSADIRNASASTSKQQEGGDGEQPGSFDAWRLSPDPLAGSAHLAHHAERSDRYRQLVELRKEGLTTKEIARRLGMAERTVRYWLKRGIPYGKPELRRKRSKEFDPYVPYITDHWQQGEQNGLRLFREL
jgi:DNA-directed RNA polymerase specialized sigma24 family protein